MQGVCQRQGGRRGAARRDDGRGSLENDMGLLPPA